MSTGESDMIVIATPVEVYCVAMSESDTPTKGPNTTVAAMSSQPRPSVQARRSAPPLPAKKRMSRKPGNPATARICVAANGRSQRRCSAAAGAVEAAPCAQSAA